MSLDENKAGAAAVDPDDFNIVVDAVVTLQAGGAASQVVQYAVKSFTAADIKATDPDTPATWQTVLPALSGAKFRMYLQPICYFRAGATPYATGSTVQLVNPGDATLLVNFAILDMTSVGDIFNTGRDTNAASNAAVTDGDPAPIIGAGSETQLYIDPQPTLGNGTLTLYLPYMVIDTAATS